MGPEAGESPLHTLGPHRRARHPVPASHSFAPGAPSWRFPALAPHEADPCPTVIQTLNLRQIKAGSPGSTPTTVTVPSDNAHTRPSDLLAIYPQASVMGGSTPLSSDGGCEARVAWTSPSHGGGVGGPPCEPGSLAPFLGPPLGPPEVLILTQPQTSQSCKGHTSAAPRVTCPWPAWLPCSSLVGQWPSSRVGPGAGLGQCHPLSPGRLGCGWCWMLGQGACLGPAHHGHGDAALRD